VRRLRLSGWQRLWMVASMLYAIPVIWLTYLQVSDMPGDAYEKRQWAVSAAELLVDYVNVTRPYMFDPVAHLFGNQDNDEVIKRIYGISLTYHARSASTDIAEDAKDIEAACKQEVTKRRIPPRKGSEEAFEIERLPSGLVPAFSKEDECKLAVLKGMIDGSALAELKNLDIQKFQAQLADLETDHKARVAKVWRERVEIIGVGFLTWLLPVIAVYILGLAVGWVYRGFKDAG